VACWVGSDRLHNSGAISETVRVAITLLGWLFLIDGVRMLVGCRSFMRYVYRYGFYLVCLFGLGVLVVWIYQALSLKALVAIGLIVAIALLVFILRELRESRTRQIRNDF
jgi:hypothetical protein